MAAATLPVSPLAARRRTRFVALPAPLIDELLQLGGDRLKIVLRLLQRATWEPTEVDGIRLDAGECLYSERSDKYWGDIRFDREVEADGRRGLVRRTIAWLAETGYVSKRPAHAFGPGSGPRRSASRGPSPSVLRFLKYREILWPEADRTTHPGTGKPAQPPAHASGPIQPGELPALPTAAASELEVALVGEEAESAPPPAVMPEADPGTFPLVRSFQSGLAPLLGVDRVRTTNDAAQWAAMDAELRRVGVDAAIDACAERAARRRAGMNAIGSLWWFLPSLRDLPDEAAARMSQTAPLAKAITAARDSCPEWGATLEVLSERISADIVVRWLLPLTVVTSGEELQIWAPTRYHRDFVRDNYREAIEQTLAATVPGDVRSLRFPE